MTERNPSSSWLRVVAVLIVAGAFVFAIAPFVTSTAGPHYALRNFRAASSESSSEGLHAFASTLPYAPQSHCSAPVLDAWRAPSASSGWFGYAPLTTTPFVAGTGCRETSRSRLQVSAIGVILAAGLLLVARRIDRRPGFGLDPAPT